PPGMPAFQGSEALARYLASKSIRYVAYSYSNEAGFPKSELGHRAEPSFPYSLARTEAAYTFDFQDNLRSLGDSRRRLYDDGRRFLLDLHVPAARAGSSAPRGHGFEAHS